MSEGAGKLIVVTGASSGIGEAAAVELARRGARVVAVGRDPGRLERAHARIAKAANGETPEALQADFSSLANVRRLAADLLERHERIDVLVNNAGLLAGSRELTEDGYERTFAVNHLAPFLLTTLLLERLKESAPARVITTASGMHMRARRDFLDDPNAERTWSMTGAYSDSKLANVIFTRALAKRLEGTGVTANCLHPGAVRTGLGRGGGLLVGVGWRIAGLVLRSPEKAAETIVHLALSDEGGELTGLYFEDCEPRQPRKTALDDDLADRLWAESERMVAPASGA